MAFGNYLNSKNEIRGGAYGFRIEAIEKAFEFKKNTKEGNLLMDCVENVYKLENDEINLLEKEV